jgi:hypothetical protein
LTIGPDLAACGAAAVAPLDLSPAAGSRAVSQIEKETNKHRTSNVEHPTSHAVFFQPSFNKQPGIGTWL